MAHGFVHSSALSRVINTGVLGMLDMATRGAEVLLVLVLLRSDVSILHCLDVPDTDLLMQPSRSLTTLGMSANRHAKRKADAPYVSLHGYSRVSN